MKTRAKIYIMLMVVLVSILGSLSIAYGQPVGTTLTDQGSSRRADATVKTDTAVAGNVTALDITATQISNTWQGYYGNITGVITLDNADNDTFYNWTFASTTGEVYASNETVSDWGTAACSSQSDIYVKEAGLGITNASAEGINDTFTVTSHPGFNVGSTAISSCRSTQAYDGTGSGLFWNVLLNVDTTSMVFASIINSSQSAFDNDGTVDFELLVPVDVNAGTEVYNFYAELS